MRVGHILFISLVYYFPFFCHAQKEEKEPNVLIILADDLGYHDLGITGSKYYETPHLDKLATRSIQFTQGYANAQVCSPSRASILTGQFPARHGITDWIGAKSGEAWRKTGRFNKLLPAEYKNRLDTSTTTLAKAFRNAGYQTFFAGKWHLGDSISSPEIHGFNLNIGGWHAGSPAGGYYDPYKNPRLKNRKTGENLSMRLALETNAFIENQLEENPDQPFFAFLSFYAVHGPIQTTQQKWKKYRDKADELGILQNGFEMGYYLPIRQTQDNPIYAGLVESMDDAIGTVLSYLESKGIDDNTIIVFTSDNGGVCSGDAFATSNLPLRGGKGYQYEGGIRVPFFIKMTKNQEQIKVVDDPVSAADLFPTLLDLANIQSEITYEFDGKSLTKPILGKKLRERPLIWHYPHYGNQGGRPSSINRMGKWKLIYFYEDDSKALYNLKEDPFESSNIVDSEPKQAKKLSEILFTYLNQVGAFYPRKDPVYSKEKELAYLEKIRQKKLPNLEKQRHKFLNPDYDPENNWWGSQIDD